MPRRKILIVDDNEINRQLLCLILGEDYEVLEAENGQEALALLHQSYKDLSAVLLDIVMPVMDGYAVLEQMRSQPELVQIPVIVTTGNTEIEAEVKALMLGANDFITKPYVPDIIKHRLKNTINLRETAATINMLMRDQLTGLYTREAFFQQAAELIAVQPAGYYVMACFDINNFKVVNDQYGNEKGDEVLKLVAKTFKEGLDAVGGITCRITADKFAALYPCRFMDSEELAKLREATVVLDGSLPPISISIGRYVIDDPSLSLSAMYDRAAMAEASIKGRFDAIVAQYDESMREHILREQEIVNEMNPALENHQFEVWLQPQYNHSSGALVGAEALVRWRRPRQGIIAPGEFIPVFERNGFIYELDKYVWERCCALLRRWLDEGRSPLPLAVNISRYDMLRDDLIAVITGLVRRYDLPVSLLRLEITESAFANSAERIISVVKSLIDYGFTVEIDDFGSGYSSLNTLKDVPAQVLKLDMRFLETNDPSGRGGNILESVVRMAKWLGMSVIAEGVETREQANYLKSIGCNYVQGYLYAKPMPVAAYEALAQTVNKEEELLALETVENLNNNAFWDPQSMDTLIFNSYVGGACIFEYHNGRIELLRATEKYAQVIGSAGMTVEDALKLDWAEHLDAENHRMVSDDIKRSIASRDEVTSEYVFLHLPGCPEKTYLRSTLRVIAAAGERYLIYCTNENITAQREAMQNEQRIAEQMQAIMANANSGVTAVITQGEAVEYLFVNDRYYEMIGYTRAQYEAEVRSAFDLIHPDDRPWVFDAVEQVNATGKPAVLEYRVIRRDGQEMWERNAISITHFSGIQAPVQLGIITDITPEKTMELRLSALNETLANLMNDTPGGFARMRVLPNGNFATEYVNDALCRRRGMTYEEILGQESFDLMSTVHPDDVALVTATVAEMMATGESRSISYRLRHASGAYIPFTVFGRVTRNENGEAFINAYYADMSEQAQKEWSIRETMPLILSAIMESSADLAYAKDKDFKYICCTAAFARLAGQEDESGVVGKTDYELFDRDTADNYRRDDMKLLAGGEPLIDYLELIPSDDGVPHYSSTSKYILRDASGAIVGLYGVGRDITQYRISFEQLKLLTDSIPGGIATYAYSSRGLRLVYFNDGLCRMMNCTREEYELATRDNVIITVFAEDLPRLQAQIKAMYEEGIPVDCTYRSHNMKDDGYKWINLRAAPAERQGDTLIVNAVLYDVTEQKSAEEAAHIHEEEMKVAMSQMGKMICEYDPVKRTLTLPEAYARQYDLPTVLAGVPDNPTRQSTLDPAFHAAYHEFYAAILRREARGEVEFRARGADGVWRWERGEFSTIFDSNGRPVKTIIAIEDTTQPHVRYELEQNRPTLGEENLLVHALFNINTGETLDYAYRDGRAVPPAERTAFTYGGDNLDTLLINPEERARYRELNDPVQLLKRYNDGETELSIDYRRRMPDGEIIWVRNLLRMMREPGGADVLLFEYCYNIEEEKTLEQMTHSLVHINYEFVVRLNGKNRHYVMQGHARGMTLQRGADLDLVTHKWVESKVHPDDRETTRRHLLTEGVRRNLAAADIFQFTCRELSPDGLVRYKKFTEYYLDKERDIIVVTREDITELMREETRKNELLEAALKAANEESRLKERETAARLQTIMNNIPGGLGTYACSPDGIRLLHFNDGLCRLLGYTREEYEQMAESDALFRVLPEDAPVIIEGVNALLRDGVPVTCTYRILTKNGGIKWISHRGELFERQGDTAIVNVVVVDVTEQTRARELLRVHEEEMRIALSQMGKMVFFYDIPTRTVTLPETYARERGLPVVMENMPAHATEKGIISERDRSGFTSFYEAIQRGEQNCVIEAHVQLKDGSWAWERAESVTIYDDEGNPVRAIIAVEDILKQREHSEANAVLTLLCDNYDAVYLLDTQRDEIIPQKLSAELGAITHDAAVSWSEYLEPTIIARVCPEYRDAMRDLLRQEAVRGGFAELAARREMIYLHTTNTWKKLVVQPMVIQDGVTQRALVTVTDITESKRQADALHARQLADERRAREYERLLFDSAAEMYASIIKINLTTGDTYQIGFEDGAPVEIDIERKWERHFAHFLASVHPDDREQAAEKALHGRLELIPPGGKVRITYRRRGQEGEYRWYTTTLRTALSAAAAYAADDGAAEFEPQLIATAFTVDINDEMNERARLKDLSEHDGLTDLFNRVKFENMRETEYRSLSSCGVLFFDVNYLKETNDTKGHEAGNALLCRVADSIRSITNRRVHGYRYGGDEFVVIAGDAPEEELDVLLQMWAARLKVLSAGGDVVSSVAVGQAWSRAPLSIDALISRADEDMYRNKIIMKREMHPE